MTTNKMDLFGKATEDLAAKGIKTAAYGIDLGTTNSCIAVVQAGNTPKVIVLENGKTTLPSCVMWKGKKKGFIVGLEAYNNRYKASASYSVKRLMGSDESIELTFGQETASFTPAQISAEILKELVIQAKKEYKDIVDVVITVPAYFNDKQIKDTVEAGKLAGLNVLSILREPTAASFVYDIEAHEKEAVRVLVYDLGGGTFDVSLVRITKQGQVSEDFEDLYGIADDTSYSTTYSVLDTDGNARLGGDDIDLALLDIVMEKFRARGVNTDLFPRSEKERILLALERYKKLGPGQYSRELNFKLKGGATFKDTLIVDYQDFVEATRKVYRRTRVLTQGVLTRSGNDNIDSIVLVGGSTKSELIKQFLKRDFPGVDINDALNPDEAVALGAAIKAKEAKFGDKSVEVFDVIPMSIGVVSSKHIRPILPRNRRVPSTETVEFTTSEDNQKSIQVDIYQGNSSVVEECFYLGSLEINDIPKGRSGEVVIYVTLSVDSNGMLSCFVETGDKKKSIQLSNLFGGNEGIEETSVDKAKEDKKVKRWRSFAQTLPAEQRKDVENAINSYVTGDASLQEVVGVIEKYSNFTSKVESPAIVQDFVQFK